MIHSIISWLYCLDITHILLLITAATGLFLYLQNQFSQTHFWKPLLVTALICWGIAVLYSTVWTRTGIQENGYALTPFHSYRAVWNGGNKEIYRSNFMNVLLFYPSGLLTGAVLPRKWPTWLRCVIIVLSLTAFSAGIEWTQYRFALGQCEIDDVIHNAAGALLGTLPVFLRHQGSSKKQHNQPI